MFNHATKGDYCFMYLNSKKPRRLRCMLNFDKVLFHKPDNEDEYESDSQEESKFQKKNKHRLK